MTTTTSTATTLSVQGSRCSSMTSVSSVMSVTSLNGFNLGDRVAVKEPRKLISLGRKKNKTGMVRFLGDTQFAVGQWVGIELDEACGCNDGSVDGMRYFQCRPNHGIFAPVHKCRLVTQPTGSGARSATHLTLKDKGMARSQDQGHNVKNASNAENVLHSQIRLLEAAADLKNAENSQLQGQLEETSRTAQEFQEKYRVCNERCSSLAAEIEGFEEALREASQARRQHELDAQSAERSIDQLQAQIEELRTQAAEAHSREQTLCQEKSALQLELGQLHESCTQEAECRLRLENQVATARETIVDLQSVIMKLEQEKTELHAQLERLDLLNATCKSEAESKDELIATLIKDQEACDLELEELKQQENILLLSVQQLETDQMRSREQVQSLREAVAIVDAEKIQWLEEKSNLLQSIDELKSQLIEAAALKEECNQRSIEANSLRTALREECCRSEQLGAALSASQTQCQQLEQRNDKLLTDNQSYMDTLNKTNVEKMQQLEKEREVALQLATEIRDKLKDFSDRALKREQKSEEERVEAKQRLAQMEETLVNAEKHLLQLRQEVDKLKKKAHGAPQPRNSGGVHTLRNHHYNSHLWRDYLILSAIRHSRLYRRHW